MIIYVIKANDRCLPSQIDDLVKGQKQNQFKEEVSFLVGHNHACPTDAVNKSSSKLYGLLGLYIIQQVNE